MTITITGAKGKAGSALLRLPYQKILIDLNLIDENIKDTEIIQCDLTKDSDILELVAKKTDILIHLAADPDPDAIWESILKNNICLTHDIFEIAVKNGIQKVIYASSNRVMQLYEELNKPNVYENEKSKLLTTDMYTCPSNLYGVSKIFGEQLAQMYSYKSKTKFYCIRIGSLLDEVNDNPYAYAECGVKSGEWQRGDVIYLEQLNRLKCTWLSRKDFYDLILACINHKGSDSFYVFNGVSNNKNRWMDIENQKEILNHVPSDDASLWLDLPKCYL